MPAARVGVTAKALDRGRAGVANDEIHAIAVADSLQGDLTTAVLERVRDQVVERLRDARGVDVGDGVAAPPADRDPPAGLGGAHPPALTRGDRKGLGVDRSSAKLDLLPVYLAVEVAKGRQRQLERIRGVGAGRLRGQGEGLQRSADLVEALVERPAAPHLPHPVACDDDSHRDRDWQETAGEAANRGDERLAHAGRSR